MEDWKLRIIISLVAAAFSALGVGGAHKYYAPKLIEMTEMRDRDRYELKITEQKLNTRIDEIGNLQSRLGSLNHMSIIGMNIPALAGLNLSVSW